TCRLEKHVVAANHPHLPAPLKYHHGCSVQRDCPHRQFPPLSLFPLRGKSLPLEIDLRRNSRIICLCGAIGYVLVFMVFSYKNSGFISKWFAHSILSNLIITELNKDKSCNSANLPVFK